jgi:uncharacterized delta-60 repeat protein
MWSQKILGWNHSNSNFGIQRFNPGLTWANNEVFSIIKQEDNKIFIVGSFTNYNRINRNRIARLEIDGSLDYSFNIGKGANSTIRSICLIDDDIIIGGDFTFFNGVSRNRIAKINNDGSIDEDFDPGLGTNGPIHTIVLQDDKILIGGSFTTYNGVRVNNIARINIDGTLDTSFNLGKNSASGAIFSIVIHNSKILIGGSFRSYNGIGRNRIARLNSDGSLDASFSIGSGFNNIVRTIAIQSDGKILVGGDFTQFGNNTINRIARLNSAGSLDSSFSIGTGFNDTVRSIAIQSDGSILVGGNFTSFNGFVRYNLLTMNIMGGILNSNLNIITTLTTRTPVINSIIIYNNNILIGGFFYSLGNAIRSNIVLLNNNLTLNIGSQYTFGIATISPVLSLDYKKKYKFTQGKTYLFSTLISSRTPNPTYVLDLITPNPAFDNEVYSFNNPIFQNADNTNRILGKINLFRMATSSSENETLLTYAASFSFSGSNYLNSLEIKEIDYVVNGFKKMELLDDGKINTDNTIFRSMSFNSSVFKIVQQSDGKIIVGGNFTTYSYINVNNETITTMVNRIVRLNTDGSIDTSFNTTFPNLGFNSSVRVIAIQNDGKIIVGGDFVTFNNISQSYISRLNTDGTIDTSFNISNFNSSVRAIAIQNDGKIIVGGLFTYYDRPINRIIRLNTDGTIDTSFNVGSGFNNTVSSIVIQSDGKILVGGIFITYNGITQNRICRLNTDGTRDNSFFIGNGFNGSVNLIVIQGDGKILVGGEFSSFNGIGVLRCIRLNSNGTRDNSFIASFSGGSILDMNLQSDGKIIVGGLFSNVNNIIRNKIVRLFENGSVDLSFESLESFGVNTILNTNLVFLYGISSSPGIRKININTPVIRGGLITPTTNNTGNGWVFENDTFYWIYATNSIHPTPIFVTPHKFNYIGKKSDYNLFNLEFTYTKNSSNSIDGVVVYLADSQSIEFPTTTSSIPNTWKIIGKFIGATGSTYSSETHTIYGINGIDEFGNKNYVVFTATQSATNNFYCSLSNFKIYGGYHISNNTEFSSTSESNFNTNSIIKINKSDDSVKFSYIYSPDISFSPTSSNNKILNSKFGNGKFLSGVWENGIWNNGNRIDNNIYDFDDIKENIRITSFVKWRITITGPTQSVNNFKIGDIVSIGNIVAIDINRNRNILRGAYRIIGKGTNSIIVEVNTNFPLRRIERDSKNHRIKITKNIWLSGAFLNGVFTGIWNYGVFKGSPMLTKMYDSIWIDGIFDGGHFNSSYYSNRFESVFKSGQVIGFTTINHKFKIGDVISVEFDNEILYNRRARITNITNTTIIVNLNSNTFPPTFFNMNRVGNIKKGDSSGLIQNFTFYDNNISNATSITNQNTSSVFSYLSWIDVNYDETSAVNIGRDGRIFDVYSKQNKTKNNLYGYPTYDILSSYSNFRDSYTLNMNEYRLGTKYNIFTDFIGESSAFKEPFNNLQIQRFFRDKNGIIGSFRTPLIGLTPLLNAGWTYSTPTSIKNRGVNINSFAFLSRTEFDENRKRSNIITGEELRVVVGGRGTVLDNTKVNIENNRYSIVEFDVVTYSVSNLFYTDTTSGIETPVINLSNMNYEDVKLDLPSTQIFDDSLVDEITEPRPMTYLPIWKPIQHLSTPNRKKIEYFYDKRNLSLNINGNGELGIAESNIVFDNIKFYEVDMIPFFKYFSNDNIYKGIQIPYIGIAPFINYDGSSDLFSGSKLNFNIGDILI